MGQGKSDAGVKFRVFFPEFHTGGRQDTDPSPARVAGLHHFFDKLLRCGRPLGPHYAGITVFKKRLPLLRAFHDHRKSCQQFFGGKSRYDSARPPSCHFLTDRSSRDGMNMSGIEESVHAAAHGFIGGRHSLIGCQNGKIGDSFLLRLLHCQAGCRCGRLKADRQKNDLLIRVFPGIGNGVLRGINDLDAGSACAGSRKAPGYLPEGGLSVLRPCAVFRGDHAGTGNPHQVSEGADRRIVVHSEQDRFINEADRSHTDRTSRTRDQPDGGRQDLPQSQTENFMGMRPAYFHDPDLFTLIIVYDLPGAGNHTLLFSCIFTHGGIASITCLRFSGSCERTGRPGHRSRISRFLYRISQLVSYITACTYRRAPRTSSASSSSSCVIFAIAAPACTMT